MSCLQARARFVATGILALLLGACGDDEPPAPTGGSGGQSGQAGAVSTAGAALAGSAAGGVATSGSGGVAGSGGASAGAGSEPMTPEELWEATYDLCDQACYLEKSACPELDLAVCVGTCQQQADNYLASGMCARELYLA